jgi:hypothetical protein
MNYMNDTLTPSDIEITRVMRLDLTADQWGLFFDEDVPATQSGGPGRSEIARILNLEIAQEFSYHEQDPALALSSHTECSSGSRSTAPPTPKAT